MVLGIYKAQNCNNLQGMVLLTVTLLMFTIMETTTKYLAEFYHSLQISWFRFSGQMLVMTPWIIRQPGFWRTARLWGQITRSVLITVATIANFIALQYIQLDMATTIMFTAPILVTLLSIVLLGERISWRRTVAVCLGFIGVMIVIHPDTSTYHPAVWLQLFTALFFALYIVLTRWLAHFDSVATQMAYMPLVGALVLLVPAIVVWQPTLYSEQGPVMLGLLLLVGGSAGIGHWFLAKASTMMLAPILAASFYQQLFYVAIAGWLVFGDLPGMSVLLGSPLLITAGLIIAAREYILRIRGTVKPRS